MAEVLVCAEARTLPSQRGERRFGKPPPDAQAALPEAHEWLISPATNAVAPSAGLLSNTQARNVFCGPAGAVDIPYEHPAMAL